METGTDTDTDTDADADADADADTDTDTTSSLELRNVRSGCALEAERPGLLTNPSSVAASCPGRAKDEVAHG